MAADIVPQLYEDIIHSFNQGIKTNKRIQKFYGKLEAGKATGEDVSRYSAELGGCASKALIKHIVPEALPDEQLYWNIAHRTIKPILEEVHKKVMEAAIKQMQADDKKVGIDLTPKESKFFSERIDDLIAKLISVYNGDKDGK